MNTKKLIKCRLPLFSDKIRIEDKWWFSSLEFNGLFSYDCVTNELILESIFNEECNTSYLHSCIFSYQNKLICVPFIGDNISVFDMKNKKMKAIHVRESDEYGGLIMHASKVGNKIYMYPCRCKRVLIFDCISESVSEIDISNYKRFVAGAPYVFRGGCVLEDKIYLGTVKNHYILEIDIENGTQQEIEIDLEDDDQITHLVPWKSQIWGLSGKGLLFIYNLKDKAFSKRKIEETNKYKQVFYNMQIQNSYIYVAGSTNGNIYRLDMNTGEIQKWELNFKLESSSSLKMWYDIAYLGYENEEILVYDLYEQKQYAALRNDVVIDKGVPYVFFNAKTIGSKYLDIDDPIIINEDDVLNKLDMFIEYIVERE